MTTTTYTEQLAAIRRTLDDIDERAAIDDAAAQTAAANVANAAARIAGGEYRHGHPNRETWAVSLWLDNDESSHYAARYAARAAFAAYRDPFAELGIERHGSPEDVAASQRLGALQDAGDAIKGIAEDLVGELGGLAGDLVGYALACVDWADVADGYIDADAVPGVDPDDDEDGDR